MILLIEDNRDNYEVMLRRLKKNHFPNPVAWRQNGREALDDLYKKGEYEGNTVPLPDWILPGVDGRKAPEMMKADESVRSVPVVAPTTSSDMKDVDRCYKVRLRSLYSKACGFLRLGPSYSNHEG